MIDSIQNNSSSGSVGPLFNSSSPELSFNNLQNVSEEDLFRFQEAMYSPSTEAKLNPEENQTQNVVLSGLENFGQKYTTIVNKFQTNAANMTIGGNEFSPAQLMEMQMALAEYAITNELVAKIADKTSQGVQTLFRNQG